MLRHIPKLIFSLFVFFLLNDVKSQSVINVADGQSIQNAIEIASAGDTIKVASGTFQESLFISKNIVLKGAGVGETILEGADNGTKAYDERRTILIYGGCTIEGFTVTQPSADVYNNHNTMGILLEASRGVVVRDCKIENHITAIYLSGATDNLIENNLFSDCGNGVLFASFLFGTNRNLVINNEFVNNGVANNAENAGLRVIPNFTGTANRISGNNIYDNSIGANNQSNTLIDVKRNWWGSPSGPRYDLNPNGQGDSIKGIVDFEPFATSSNSSVELNRITGVVYIDENENKIKDDNEDGLFNQMVTLFPDTITTFTDENGNYDFNVLDGNYILQIIPQENFNLTNDSDIFQVSLPGSDKDGYDFGFSPSSELFEVNSTLSSARTRCGFTVPFWLSYQNSGNTKASGKVKLLADSKTTFISSTISPVTDGDTLIWDFSDLSPNEVRTIRLEYRMPGPISIGDTLNFVHITEAIFNGNIVSQSIDTLASELRCAYDPNDKTATPFGILDENYTLKDEPIEYRIRFQNTGNDTAFNIVVRDTIQADFDLSSFKIIANSHKMRTAIDNKTGEIAFSFDNILLPDSTEDEVNSHGFIKFQITPKGGLPDETVVRNTAHIYFDFNPPIVTNTTMNTLVDVLPVERPTSKRIEDISKSISLFPNPSNGDEIFLRVETRLYGNYEYFITDLTGKKIIGGRITKQQSQQDFRIDTSELNAGLYLVQIIQDEKRAVKKMIKQ